MEQAFYVRRSGFVLSSDFEVVKEGEQIGLSFEGTIVLHPRYTRILVEGIASMSEPCIDEYFRADEFYRVQADGQYGMIWITSAGYRYTDHGGTLEPKFDDLVRVEWWHFRTRSGSLYGLCYGVKEVLPPSYRGIETLVLKNYTVVVKADMQYGVLAQGKWGIPMTEQKQAVLHYLDRQAQSDLLTHPIFADSPARPPVENPSLDPIPESSDHTDNLSLVRIPLQQKPKYTAPISNQHPDRHVELPSLLRLKVHHETLSQWLAGFQTEPKISRYKDCYYYIFHSYGIELCFSKRHILRAIFLYAGGRRDYLQYRGKIPYNLSFSDTRQDVENNCGLPHHSGVTSSGYWATYDYGFQITYETASETDMSNIIQYIQIFKGTQPWPGTVHDKDR